MNRRFLFVLAAQLISLLLFQQAKFNYYKSGITPLGISAISVSTINAKTYTFSYPVYRVIADSAMKQLIVSVRQKDATGRAYTSRGYHFEMRQNDSVGGLLEDNKLEMEVAGDKLIFSNDKKSSLFNREFGYEQFEFPARLIQCFPKSGAGLLYNPSVKGETEIPLSLVNLKDGHIIWTADVPSAQNWNDVRALNDSVILVAAGGIHAINVKRGLVWSHRLSTSLKITKPLTYSSFHAPTFQKYFHPAVTSSEEGFVWQLSSDILVSNNKIFYASRKKLLSLDSAGNKLWSNDLSESQVSSCLLFDFGQNVLLLNPGIALYNQNEIQYGKPFVAAYSKASGEEMLNEELDMMPNIADFMQIKDGMVFANKDKVMKLQNDLKVMTLIELGENRYGKFLEFINGDEYFVEKEGFYVPLNFINDNVVYFKTDHGKVFGIDKSEIEYEYHFTELYKLNTTVEGKKLISQKNKTLLISPNFELLCTFNTGENAYSLNGKIYFTAENKLHIVNTADLK
jgi:outer membrane protein assembly factor BamB